jgi:hypothetical protein
MSLVVLGCFAVMVLFFIFTALWLVWVIVGAICKAISNIEWTHDWQAPDEDF